MNLKKFSLIALIVAMSSTAFGASIDHIQNYTAEYNANPAQQAAISATTSPFFNPAGLMRLPNGTYFTGGVQLAIGEESMRYSTNGNNASPTHSDKYDADLLAPIPNFAIFKKTDDRTYFWTFSGIAGGGDLKYEDGFAGLTVLEDFLAPFGAKDTGSWAEGEHMYGQTTIGMAWNVTNKLSMSVGARAVYGWRELKGEINAEIGGQEIPDISIDSKRTAWGFGGQIGLNYAANDTWNFAMRYDTKVRMNFEADTEEKIVPEDSWLGNLGLGGLGFSTVFPQYVDGAKYRRDLPAILALGASQKVTDRWTMFYGFNYYFNESATIDKKVKYNSIKVPNPIEPDKPLVQSKEITGIEYDNGYEISIGTEYWINDKYAILGGANYSKTGAKAESYSDIEFALDSFMVGLGVKYRPDEDTEWVVSTNHYFYNSEDGAYSKKYPGANNQRYDKDISSIGFSYTKRF